MHSNTCCSAVERKNGKTSDAQVTRPADNRPAFVPPVDIAEFDHEITLTLDLPGASPESVNVDLDKGNLTIHASVEPRAGARWLRREYGVGDYHRVFEVSDQIDSGAVTAEFNAGVLTVHLPKAAKAVARRVTVHTQQG